MCQKQLVVHTAEIELHILDKTLLQVKKYFMLPQISHFNSVDKMKDRSIFVRILATRWPQQ